MTHSFKPGDRVVIVRSPCAWRIGTVTAVTSELFPLRSVHPAATELRVGDMVHSLDIPSVYGEGYVVTYRPDQLEPYRPDHNERAEWTDELRKLCGVREDA